MRWWTNTTPVYVAVTFTNMQDVAEANATIRELHSALSQTRYKLVRIQSAGKDLRDGAAVKLE